MNRKPRAKWTLPSVVNPAGRRCITIDVPDDPYHIAAFRGALLSLASAYNWEDDQAHTAKSVAAVWKTVVDNSLEWGCGQLQIRACTLDCGIEWSTDGAHWNCISLENCIADITNGVIQDMIADGRLPRSGIVQPAPQSAPTPGTCRTYHVALDANGRWLCPSPVTTGDVITLSNATGAWNDGSGFGAIGPWVCPDGGTYGLGQCGGGQTFVAGDPMPTVHHMTPIAHIGTTYLNLATALTIPAGFTDAKLEIQANDAALADNLGSIEFDLEVCSGVWTHTFVGATLHAWLLLNGQGQWVTDHWARLSNALYVYKNLPVLSAGRYLDLTSITNPGNGNGYYNWRLFAGANVTGATLKNGIISMVFPAAYTGGGSALFSNAGSDPNTTLSSVTIRGTGIDPF